MPQASAMSRIGRRRLQHQELARALEPALQHIAREGRAGRLEQQVQLPDRHAGRARDARRGQVGALQVASDELPHALELPGADGVPAELAARRAQAARHQGKLRQRLHRDLGGGALQMRRLRDERIEVGGEQASDAVLADQRLRGQVARAFDERQAARKRNADHAGMKSAVSRRSARRHKACRHDGWRSLRSGPRKNHGPAASGSRRRTAAR